MNLINRQSEIIKIFRHGKIGAHHIRIKKSQIYFSSTFCKTHGFDKGGYVHFLNDRARWNFFINSNPDGFKLMQSPKKDGAMVINNRVICSMILKSLNTAKWYSYYVQGTETEMEKAQVFEVLTAKPIELMGND